MPDLVALVDSVPDNRYERTDKVFATYDLDLDGRLDGKELGGLLRDLFTDLPGDSQVSELVEQIGGQLDRKQFDLFFSSVVLPVLKPKKCFLVVDVQNDFISGSLALRHCPAGEEGAEVVPVINGLLGQNLFHEVVYTQDWHPADHISFADNVSVYRNRPGCSKLEKPTAEDEIEKLAPFSMVEYSIKVPTLPSDKPVKYEQCLWPAHCVQGSQGAEFPTSPVPLKVVEGSHVIKKGQNKLLDSYSAFWDNLDANDTGLNALLGEKLGVTDVYVCGLATDICVFFTARHALQHNYRVLLVEDCCRGVDKAAIESAKTELLAKGALIIQSSQVPDYTSGKVRPAKLGRVNIDKFRRELKAAAPKA